MIPVMLRQKALEVVERYAAVHAPKKNKLASSVSIVLRGLDVVLVRAYAGFAARAAQNMGAWDVRGPAGLPMTVRRWSILSSPHVHKTAWTQFERRTHRHALVVGGIVPRLVKPYLWYIGQHAPPNVDIVCRVSHRVPLDVILSTEEPPADFMRLL